jgi:NAD-dependent SIR2 family protein deacetylase
LAEQRRLSTAHSFQNPNQQQRNPTQPNPTQPIRRQEFYHYRREIAGACRPNAAHYALTAFQKRLAREGRTVDIITQNVDGLSLVRAGVGLLLGGVGSGVVFWGEEEA